MEVFLMNMNPDYKLIAIEMGDLLKYDTTNNEINRVASYSFDFQINDNFQCDSITSSRALSIYQWIMTLASQKMDNIKRNKLLFKFLEGLMNAELNEKALEILDKAGISDLNPPDMKDFYSRNFHSEIHKHCRNLYKQKNYFHSVFEAVKAYNNLVKAKTSVDIDGQKLMMLVWGEKGLLKISKCQNQSERDFEEGIKFLSAGLMSAIRNPTAHEPALFWPISKEDCLDMLSFISYLFRQLDIAVCFKFKE